ncbi:copper(I)-binding protein [Pseudarthrobacter oxydans]|jgi:periplasmic copper chaperone A|uniref:Copper(I)-binding protein n=1 Tax=Pseudarthrobacter oxydans TaxID=1671 RepID=A0AAW8NED4_PSEOX|nr:MULTISPECIES: copper chaperone PCu(A)C [Micrococcaceae]MDR7165886.1 copper(I)-binding protein [Pseudarthrobacter oxydans]TNB67654.1 copper chaperone PCu(A)C [Arthrobacter sp. BB-1]
MSKNPVYPALSLLAAAALALTGCAPAASTQTPAASAVVDSTATDALAVSQPWVKAATSGMTGGFGVITNTSGADITITGASSPAARTVELHETVTAPTGAMQMQAKEGGFVIPAGGELRLEPGANHLMLMGLPGPVTPGAEVTFTLELAGGGSFEFTALAKDFSGANENYVGEGAGMSHGQPSGTAESSAGAMPTSK